MRVGLVVLPGLGQDATAASLVAQWHPDWSGVLLGTASGGDARVTASGGDARVSASGGDARLTASDVGLDEALAGLAGGADWVGVLGAGDELRVDALQALVRWSARTRPAWVYADEEGAGGVFRKPGWSPDYLHGTPYTGRPALLRADVATAALALGPLDPGAPEWDLALRAGDAGRPLHVPRVLLTRRGPSLPDVDLEVAARLLGPRGLAVGRSASPSVVDARPLRSGPLPPVTVVVPTAGGSRTVRGTETVVVENCLRSLLEVTAYGPMGVLVVLDAKTPPDVAARLRALDPRVACVDREGPFDFSAIVELGVAAAPTELVVLLNDDTEVLQADWLTRLVELGDRPGVGAVGAQLLLEDGRLQHVGVAHNVDGLPVHVQWGEQPDSDYFGSTTATLDYCAVTAACVLTKRSVYAEVGGFSPDYPVNYNDVDYCLRLVTAGWRVLQANAVRLHHFESTSRVSGTLPGEEERFLAQWGERTFRDPYAQLFRWAGFVPASLA